MSEWNARIDDDPEAFTHNRRRLQLWRTVGDYVEAATGNVLLTRFDPATVPETPPGLLLPHAALEAIAVALHPLAPHAVEVKTLREALEIERGRVDRVLFGARDAT